MPLGTIALLLGLGLISQIETAPIAPEDGAAEAFAIRLPDHRLGTRSAPILLLTRRDVRAELGMEPEQVKLVRLAIAEFYARASALRGRSGPEVVEARRAVDEAARQWLHQHLSVAQRARLDQIDLQWQGVSALVSRPTVSAALELSGDQKDRLIAIINQRDLLRDRGTGLVEVERLLHRQAMPVLTADQRQRWHAMIGPAFHPEVSVAPSSTSSVSDEQ